MTAVLKAMAKREREAAGERLSFDASSFEDEIISEASVAAAMPVLSAVGVVASEDGALFWRGFSFERVSQVLAAVLDSPDDGPTGRNQSKTRGKLSRWPAASEHFISHCLTFQILSFLMPFNTTTVLPMFWR